MSSDTSPKDITRLLQAAETPDSAAAEQLLTLVYDQLRKIAQQRMTQERAGHTLQATALVHEAYLRLTANADISWQGRAHFFFAAGRAMQQILIEHARARGRVKRGGGALGRTKRAPLNVADLASQTDSEEILALNEAFCRLETEEPEAAAVVRLRFFAGLSGDDTAAALGISPRQVDRLWAFARAWLYRRLERNGELR